MKIIKKTESEIRLENQLKKAQVENDKLKADIDYISMISEIDIPEADDEQI